MKFRGPAGPKGQRRNYSHRTAKTYLRIVREFAEYFHLSPDKLGPEQIRQYQAHLFQTRKLAAATVAQHASALRFLFIKTLRRHFLSEFIPLPKCPKRLPTVLSPEEVDSTRTFVAGALVDRVLRYFNTNPYTDGSVLLPLLRKRSLVRLTN